MGSLGKETYPPTSVYQEDIKATQDHSLADYELDRNKMGDHIMLDLEEWALVLNKMLRFHFNISEEIKAVVQV